MWSLQSLPVEIDLIPVLFPPRLLPFSPSWLSWAEELGTIVMVYLTTGPKTRQPSDHELKPQVKTSFPPSSVLSVLGSRLTQKTTYLISHSNMKSLPEDRVLK